jgi:hypothetical protein
MRRYFTILFLFLAAVAVYSEDIITVARVEIRGLVNLDRFDIMKDVRTGVKDNQILIDVDSLKRELEKNILVRDYSLTGEKDTLVITVAENYPVFNIVISDENQSIPYLVDIGLNILDSGRFFKTDMPIITAERMFFETGTGRKIAADIIKNLVKIKKENALLSGELAEINVYSSESLNVKLKNRRTVFLVKNSYSGFMKLEKTAAFLDKRNNYPHNIDLRDDMVLVR